MKLVWTLIACCLAATAFSGCAGAPGYAESDAVQTPRERPVLVFAAASTINALDEIKQQFEHESGVQLQISCAASSTLARQIANGAGADVFLSANVQWADFVEKEVDTIRRRDLLENRLVIIVPAGQQLKIQEPADLLDRRVEHLALADPDAVPAGIYAKQALQRLELWNGLRPRVVSGGDVRQTLFHVETGAAEAGIVYATDAAASREVEVAAEIDPDLTGPITYPVVLLKNGSNSSGAEAFFQYLASPRAAEVFRKFGFVVPSQPGG